LSDLLYYADSVIINNRPVHGFIYEEDNDIAAGTKVRGLLYVKQIFFQKNQKEIPNVQIVIISSQTLCSKVD